MPEDGLTPRGVVEPVAPVNAASGREGERTRRPPVRSLLKDPVVPILLLAGLFDWLSGNPIHSLLLFVVAFGLGWEAVRGRPGGPEPVQRHLDAGSTMAPLAWLGAIAYAAVAGGFGRYSWPATVAVIVPAAAMLAIAWRGRAVARHELGPLDRAGALAWAATFVALGLWELTQLLLQPSLTTDSHAHPTLSVLTDPVLATHPGRSVALLAWLAFGGFLVRR